MAPVSLRGLAWSPRHAGGAQADTRFPRASPGGVVTRSLDCRLRGARPRPAKSPLAEASGRGAWNPDPVLPEAAR